MTGVGENALMRVIDGHCDSIANLTGGGPLINKYNFSSKYPQLQFVALFCGGPGQTPDDAHALCRRYLDLFAAEAAKKPELFSKVTRFCEIEEAWNAGKHAALLTEEGGSCIRGSAEGLREIYEAGVRVFGLAWLSNDLAKSNRIAPGEEDTGLTAAGREVIAEGNRLGMIFDVSHLSDRSFYDVMELSEKPPVATHSNFRALCSHSRNLTDEMARLLAGRGGMIGLNLYPPFISDDPEKQTVDGLLAQLDYALETVGEDRVGFGFDIDGVSGHYPQPLDTTASIHDRIIETMLRAGYSEDLVAKIAWRNWYEYLRKYL